MQSDYISTKVYGEKSEISVDKKLIDNWLAKLSYK